MNISAALYTLLGVIIFCVDRITKQYALVWCADTTYDTTYQSTSFLSCELVMNRGISWGLFHSADVYAFIIVSLVIACVTGFICWHAYDTFKHGASIIGHVCIITGSVSNLIDRVVYGGVIDFILLSYKQYSWPVFNVADMAIVLGVVIIFYSSTSLVLSRSS